MSNVSGYLQRGAVVYTILILIALAHIFRLGRYLEGSWFDLYYSYFSDIVLPFGFYFMMSTFAVQAPADAAPPAVTQAFSLFGRWQTKAAIAFLLPALAETCQYFGIPVLGATFDPLDYLMYALGVLAAVLVDTRVFARTFRFWTMPAAEN